MDIDALRTELTSDPLAIGYSAMSDEAATVSLNDATSGRTRNRDSMTGREIAAEVAPGAYEALTDVKKGQFLSLSSGDSVDPFGFAVNVIKDIFGAGSDTVTALAVARVEAVSRATEIGLGGTVKAGNVQEARS